MSLDMWWVEADEKPDEEDAAPKRQAKVIVPTEAARVALVAQQEPSHTISAIHAIGTKMQENYDSLNAQVGVLNAKIALQGKELATVRQMLDGLGRKLIKFMSEVEMDD